MRTLHGAAIAVLASAAVCACSPPSPSSGGPRPSGVAAAGDLTCTDTVITAPLPTWARAGFSPPDQRVRQVRGEAGSILGVVFGDPLRAPDVAGHSNKILWVPSPISGTAPSPLDPDLEIHATLNGTDVSVDRVVPGGPGPSIVDMPTAGCWTFHLSWSGRADRLGSRIGDPGQRCIHQNRGGAERLSPEPAASLDKSVTVA